MPVSQSSDLKTVAYVLTREQVEAIAEHGRRLSTPLRKANKSVAAREVVAAGLAVLSVVPDMHSGASTSGSDRDAEAAA